ncbi:hypothetical protein GLE_5174 [Lysobacter enzymogenes]|uniref:Uncharacterized protein n=1 Tax=Lysobacter enzymogenes TaxID=69 RepID=A0A0S2DPY8_LYSEN|nr:hypothetical protein GLE_5174 [Lysobacter enzymogenes]
MGARADGAGGLNPDRGAWAAEARPVRTEAIIAAARRRIGRRRA